VTYRVQLTRSARQALENGLPEAAAVACWEFIRGPLAENPHRVGNALQNELQGRYSARRGDFRVIYQVNDDQVVVSVINIRHRRGVYRR